MWPEIVELQRVLAEMLAGRNGLRVLEAGCGSTSYFTFPEDTTIDGLDVSRKQLDANPMLSTRIRGDIQTYELEPDSYDVIVCWYVLEHVSRPEAALRNFATALKPGGLVVLEFPNPLSFKGLITKFTPHWFHVWVYKHLLGFPEAGRPECLPFRTIMRWSIAPDRIERLASELGLTVAHRCIFESVTQKEMRQKYLFVRTTLGLMNALATVLSLGRMQGLRSDCIYVLRK